MVQTLGGAYIHKVVHTQSSACTRRCIQEAGRTQGRSLPPKQYFCYLRRVWDLAPVLSEHGRPSSKVNPSVQCVCEGLAVHTQGGAYTRQGTHKAGYSKHRRLVI